MLPASTENVAALKDEVQTFLTQVFLMMKANKISPEGASVGTSILLTAIGLIHQCSDEDIHATLDQVVKGPLRPYAEAISSGIPYRNYH